MDDTSVIEVEWCADNHYIVHCEYDEYAVWAMNGAWWIVYVMGASGPESSEGPFETVDDVVAWLDAED